MIIDMLFERRAMNPQLSYYQQQKLVCSVWSLMGRDLKVKDRAAVHVKKARVLRLELGSISRLD